MLGGFWLFSTDNSPATATVQHVVDGDTPYVLLEGTGTKVRLLKVDAPEVAHGDRPGQCFGESASDFLARQLPKGTTVQLFFDVERHDPYVGTLAAVTRKGEFINESLMVTDHAKAMKAQQKVKYCDQLRAAQRQFQRKTVGIFDPATGYG